MDTVACAPSEEVQGGECLSENLFRENALDNAVAPHIDVWLRRRVGGDPLRPLEVVIIVASAAAHCKADRHAGATASCTTDPLLIVEPHWWHIGHHDSEQGADIDARLHSGGDTQKINWVS